MHFEAVILIKQDDSVSNVIIVNVKNHLTRVVGQKVLVMIYLTPFMDVRKIVDFFCMHDFMPTLHYF